MTDKDIHDALERIKPDDAARKRMLQNIMQSAKQPPRKKHHVRRTLLLAAAIATALSVAASADGSDFFGLWSIGIRDTEIYSPVLTDNGYIPGTEVVDMISMQGFRGSPEYQASMEWNEFYQDYTDGYDFESAGEEGISAEYDAYACFDTVMQDKLDELCERYGLELLGPILDPPGSLFDSAGVGDVCSGSAEDGKNICNWGYYFSGGTFFFEGSAEWNDGTITDYQFKRAVKGYLSTDLLNVGDLDEYQQWEYTTENGVPLLLTLGSSKGLIFADREESFVTVNVLGDWTNIPEDIPENWQENQFCLTRSDMEALAEMFDFSAIP